MIKDAGETMAVVKKIIELKDKLEASKPLYQELDELVIQLSEMVEVGESFSTEDHRYLTLIDNFAEKNTVFRPVGVKRFDLELLTAEEREKKLAKAAKKAEK